MNRALSSTLVLAACAGTPPADEPDVEEACGAEERVVRFETADGETLAADFTPAPSADAPAVVLLHMNPVAFDRTGYPKRVRRALAEAGWAVLNVDRRGAGDSTGDPEEATVGAGALRDAEAAVAFLVDAARGCAIDPDAIALVGASNGTTAAFDYLAAVPDEDGRDDFPLRDAALPAPAALAFLSPGTYTESNYRFSLDRETGERWKFSLPLLWLFPETEPYATDFVLDAPSAWSFIERGREHGTNMFDDGDLEAATVSDLVDFLGTAFAPGE